jgi:thymidylate synthase (FAD)
MKIENVLGDGIGYVHLLDHMGDDVEIVRRARVCYQSQEKSTPESDARLLKQIVGSPIMHGTTLRGVVFTFDVVAPRFVVRQWTRHLAGHDYDGNDSWHIGQDTVDVGGSFDEQSFRYTEPGFLYIPSDLEESQWTNWLTAQYDMIAHYRKLRDSGVQKQLARCFVPDSVYTQMTWTCNGQAVLDWLSKRLPGNGAQSETAKYAEAILKCVRAIIPETVKIWESKR